MKGHRMPASHVTHPNVTPLIDVVMCLIIFYMLVARIGVKTGADRKIELPVSFQGVSIKDLGNTVTLNVVAAADLPMVTTLNPQTGQTEEVKIIEAGARRPLRALLQRFKGQNVNFKVIIRGDQDLDYRYLEPVLIECSEAKVSDIRFATRKAKE